MRMLWTSTVASTLLALSAGTAWAVFTGPVVGMIGVPIGGMLKHRPQVAVESA